MTTGISMSRLEPVARDLRFESGLNLPGDEVAFWTAALDGQSSEGIEFMAGVISPAEAERARQFRFERDRRRFVLGRGILRTILGRYLDQPAARIELRYGANGKPMLAGDAPEPRLHFNVAHSDGLALYAFSRGGEVGVDLERVRDIPEWEQIAAASFSPAESARLRAGGDSRRATEFLRCWTRHEAILKAAGLGLGGAAGAAAVDGGRSAAGFRLYSLHPEPGYIGAAAVGAAARWESWFAWQPDAEAPDFMNARRGRRSRFALNTFNGFDSP